MPISKHPLFPAMVALWFAALFGLGSLAIRPTLLEKFVLALRLDLVVPAAAPPLGFTSRILLALMMFVIGAVIGFVVARRVAGSGAERGQVRPARASAASFRASAAVDGDFDRLDAGRPATSHQIPGRRRALAMEEDYVNDYRDHAPLPGNAIAGHEPQILDLATLGGLTEYVEPAEVVSAEAVIEIQPVQAAAPEPTFDPWNRHTPEAPAAEVYQEQAPAVVDALDTESGFRAFDAPVEPVVAAEELPAAQPMDFHRPAFAAPELQPMEPAVQQVEEEPSAIAPAPPAFDPAPVAAPAQVVAEEPAAPQAAPSVGLGLMPRDAVEKLTSAPLASLGVVQLAERLALAIARRKAPGEEAPAFALPVAFEPAPPAFFQPEPAVSAVEPEPEPEALAPAAPAQPAAEPVQAPAIPRSMRPLSWDDEEDDEDEALHAILPPRRFAMPAPSAVDVAPVAEAPAPAPAPEPVTAAKPEEDENFASLLGMKPSLRQSFVRVDEPVEPEAPIEPVVIFPGQAPRFASVARPFEGPAQPAPAPVAVPSPEPTPIEAGRRFDAPSAMPAFTPASAPAIDPEETERALKAALATLQRMSGAA